MDTARAGANAARVTPKLLPYMKARTRCQLWLGRTLRASDNLMQLCVHGGQLTYGNGAAAGKDAALPAALPKGDTPPLEALDAELESEVASCLA